MRILILIFLMALSSLAQTPTIEPGVSQELAKWRAAHYSDVRYKLDLRLAKMSPVLAGTIEVRVVVRDAVSEGHGDAVIVLDWRKIRGHEEKSTISNVSVNGKRAVLLKENHPVAEAATPLLRKEGSFAYEESKEHLIFRDGVVAGENLIKLDFTSPILPSGSAITRYIDKEDGSEYIYSLFVPSDASTAFPVFDQPDLKARFDLFVNAPKDWQVISNTDQYYLRLHDTNMSRAEGERLRKPPGFSFFNSTKPISTYVFAFAAGPWQQVSESRATEVTGGNPTGREGVLSAEGGRRNAESNPKSEIQNLKSSIYVRKSQLAKFQPHSAEVFRLNREAIKYFEEYFDYKFPFPKYDLVLIPEFPFGGMEHAGATFLREAAIIFPSEPTKNDIASRATLIFHEAAHQWFGDTVTMRWFDDLWLKEGFANFTAYKAMEKIMPEMNAWKIFYERIKQGAYQTDSTKGTTAIYQPIPNLSAAKSAYGNIVYNKAPAFLRQAEFYLGEDKFRTAVRAFLKKHEFKNAEWKDLIAEFESVSHNELHEWANVWVMERGLPLYRIEVSDRSPQNLRSFYLITQDDYLAKNRTIEEKWRNGFEVLERFVDEETQVKSYSPGGIPQKTLAFSVDNLRKREGKVERTYKALSFVFPNYRDYGYGIFLLDDKSRDYILKNIQNEKDPFLRSMMWGSLWDSVREGELAPKEYVELAIKVQSASFSSAARGEERAEARTLNAEDESTTSSILNRVSTSMTYYMSVKDRDAIAPRLEALLIEKMRTAPTLGQRITYYRALLSNASTENGRRVLRDMLATTGGNPTGREGVEPQSKNTLPTGRVSASTDIPLKTKDRFDIVTRLASLNDPDAESLLKELEKTETSDDAKRYAYAARAAFPTKETKEKFWNDFINNKQISESWIEAAFGPFNSVRHADLTLPYLERALKELPNHKRNRKIFFVNGWLGAFIGGQKSEQALAIVNKFLADNPNLDRDLRLKILENVDVIERAVKIRGTFATR